MSAQVPHKIKPASLTIWRGEGSQATTLTEELLADDGFWGQEGSFIKGVAPGSTGLCGYIWVARTELIGLFKRKKNEGQEVGEDIEKELGERAEDDCDQDTLETCVKCSKNE